MVQKFMVEKSGVEKLMVEKSGVERSGVEATLSNYTHSQFLVFTIDFYSAYGIKKSICL